MEQDSISVNSGRLKSGGRLRSVEHALEAIWDLVIWTTRFVTEFSGAETTPLITGPRHSTLSSLLEKGGDGGSVEGDLRGRGFWFYVETRF